MFDMAMSWTLCKLDAASSSSLWLRRLAPSKYEIDGRRVSVTWRNQKRTDLLAFEDDVPTAEKVPLLDYLQQAASVARSLAAPQVSPPAHKRVTYEDNEDNDAFAPRGYSDVDSERVRSMMLACREAGVKEARFIKDP